MAQADVPGAEVPAPPADLATERQPARPSELSTDLAGRARALLDQAEAGLATGDIDAAETLLADMAGILAVSEDRSSLVGQALWLAAMVSLTRGRLDEFARTSASAIDGYVLAGDTQTADALRQARAELVQRIEHEYAVRTHGASGLLDVLAEQAATLLARARGEVDWDTVDRDRDQLAALVELPAPPGRHSPTSVAGLLPLARLVRALELDSIESMVMAVLVPLCARPELAAQARELAGEQTDGQPDHGPHGEPEARPGFSAGFLASLLFSQPSARESVIHALGPRAPLVRYRAVRLCDRDNPRSASPWDQRVTLEPALLWFMRATPLTRCPLPEGVTAYHPEDFWLDIAPPLRPVVETLSQAFAAPRSSLLVLAGRPGTGKLTATLAAAAQAGRPLIAVDADALSEEPLREALAVAVRDAFLHGAVLLIRWQWQRSMGELPTAVRAALAEPGLRLCVATTEAHGRMVLDLVRQKRADVALLTMPAVAESEQHLAWRESLAALGVPVADENSAQRNDDAKHDANDDDDDIQAQLCRPGLSIGDIVETVVEAIARSDALGQPVTVASLATCLNERLVRELETWAEVVPPDERPLAALMPAEAARRVADWVADVAETIRGGQLEFDELGLAVAESARPERIAGGLFGGSANVDELVALALARQTDSRLARIDIDALMLAPVDAALAHLRDTAAAAGRAGAILLVERADSLAIEPANPLTHSLARLLADRPASILLCADEPDNLPLALAVRLDDRWRLDLRLDLPIRAD